MSYTWEEVLYGIDTKAEGKKKQDKLDKINQMKEDEKNAMSAWGLGMSLLGGALFGPGGAAAAKILTRSIVDNQYKWEDEELEVGKFNTDLAKDINKNLKKEAKDQNRAQVVQAITDLGTMYVQGGGMTEGLGADFTTYGAGGDQWTVFGRDQVPIFGEQANTLAPGPGGVMRRVDLTPVTFEEGIPSIFDVWRDDGLKDVGDKLKDVYTAEQSVNKTMSELDRLAS